MIKRVFQTFSIREGRNGSFGQEVFSKCPFPIDSRDYRDSRDSRAKILENLETL